MKFALYIAKRYLFSKKSHNVINLISGISVLGVTISTMALIVVLSAFNGIGDLVESLYSNFDTDFRIEIRKGKSFAIDSLKVNQIKKIEGVQFYSESIEDIVILKHEDQWVSATLKGVDEDFLKMTNFKDCIVSGEMTLEENELQFGIMGSGLMAKLGAYIPQRENEFETVQIYGPNRKKKIRKTKSSFNQKTLRLSSRFIINHEFDFIYCLSSKKFASELLDYKGELTSIEIGLFDDFDSDQVKQEIEKVLGAEFIVKDRYQQNELIYKTNKTEKLITFMVLCAIFVLATFNIIGSLTMLVLDKKKDLLTLKALGVERKQVLQIFFFDGMLINIIGAVSGLILGTLLILAQMYFHLIPLEGTVIEYYPVKMKWQDFVMIMSSILIIGAMSSWFPVRYLVRKHF